MSFGIAPPAFRLPAETHIGLVRLQVSDLARSLEFYQGVLGFEVLQQDGRSGLLAAGGLPLIVLQAGATGPLRQRRLGLYHFAILLPDRPALGRCLGHLAAHGISPGAADHLVSEALYLSDPDGLGIEIYRDRPRSEWKLRQGELAMASEALDFQDVLDSGAGSTWDGMPAGTSIGHIHLHVGDLEAARAFYHAALGLDLVVWSYPGALFLSAGGYHHHLGLNTWAGPAAQPAESRDPKLLEWQLTLPSPRSIADAVDNVQQHGYTITSEQFGCVVLADPWGTNVQLTTSV